MQLYYPSKILILGEYTVLSGSSFLAIPYAGYRSSWSMEAEIDVRLLKFCDYIDKQRIRYIDVALMKAEVNKGLQLNSSIPIGYGAGSSGSLVAAVYDRFGNKTDDVPVLRQQFANLEAYFHGHSSGIDPLVSYLNKPLGSSNGTIKVHDDIDLDDRWFLLDSGESRSTDKLIDIFKFKLKSEEFKSRLDDLIEYNNRLHCALINKDYLQIQAALKNISTWQLTHFEEMIPDPIAQIWQEGLITNTCYFKLCGAGGGGFFLGYDMGGEELTSSFVRRSLRCDK